MKKREIILKKFLQVIMLITATNKFFHYYGVQVGGDMKSYRKELRITYPKRRGYVNITPEVEQALK